MQKVLKYSLIVALVFVVGCATVPPQQVKNKFPEPEKTGVYHKVKRGETLWRIATTYNVSIDDIIKSNDIPNVAQIEEHQLLFIPGAFATKEVIISQTDTDDFIWPVKGKVIKYFHDRDGYRVNKGINIQVSEGTTIKAARGGAVVFSDFLTGYGYTVIVDHQDGLYSVYAQNAALLVKLGDKVSRGQDIGQIAKSDNDLAYAHFEIRRNSTEQNPFYFLP